MADTCTIVWPFYPLASTAGLRGHSIAHLNFPSSCVCACMLSIIVHYIISPVRRGLTVGAPHSLKCAQEHSLGRRCGNFRDFRDYIRDSGTHVYFMVQSCGIQDGWQLCISHDCIVINTVMISSHNDILLYAAYLDFFCGYKFSCKNILYVFV